MHMCAVLISLKDDDLGRFIAQERLRDSLVATSVGMMILVDMDELINNGMKPPVITKKSGRPRTKRIPSCVEKRPKTVKCGRCRAADTIAEHAKNELIEF